MRNTYLIAIACSVALAGCGGGASTAGTEDEPKAKSTKVVEDEGEAEEEEAPARAIKSEKSSGSRIGKWTIDSQECVARQMSGGNGIKIQQTSSALNIYFLTDWVSDVEGPVDVSGEEMEPSAVPEDGQDWIMVSRPNEDFGGLHDIIANSSSIKFSYSGNQQSFSLADSNRVMDKLRKCAGL